jgi:hypothetical protein
VYNVLHTAQIGAYGPFFDGDTLLCASDMADQAITAQGFQALPAGQCGVPILA